MRMVWWAAAAVILLLGITNGLPNLGGEEEEVQVATMSLSDISPEMEEVETYFTSSIKKQQTVVAETPMAPKHNDLLDTQLEQLEKDYERLRLELTNHPGDERIIRYMVENYRLRLLLLETHLDKIKAAEQPTRLVE